VKREVSRLPGDDDTADTADTKKDLYRRAADEAEKEKGNPRYGVSAAAELLKGQLKAASDTLAAGDEMAACGAVLAEIAEEHAEAEWVLEYLDDNVGTMAMQTGIGADKIISGVTPPIREVRREQNEEKIEEKVGTYGFAYSLEYGIGIDEYVEDHLDRVLKLETRDHKSDRSIVFEFDDGTSVEFEDNDHRNIEAFCEEISVAAPGRIRSKIASKEAAGDIDGNPFDASDTWAREKYRELSLGPEERPWGLSWNEVITHLEEAAGETMDEPPAGPNTDAWEDLQAAIENGRAAHDKQSVVDAGNGAVHYYDEHDEVWVPTSMVDNACEDYATNRKSLVHELDARGVTTDEISGVGCSEADFDVEPPIRWWRFDASDEDVRLPTIVQEIENSTDPFASTAGDAAADGGTTKFTGGDE